MRRFLLWLLRPIIDELIEGKLDDLEDLVDQIDNHEHSDLADSCDIDQAKMEIEALEVRVDNLESEVADLG